MIVVVDNWSRVGVDFSKRDQAIRPLFSASNAATYLALNVDVGCHSLLCPPHI